MKNRNDLPSAFSLHSLVAAALPAYMFPAIMSFASGFLLQKNDLMQASYTTIGLSSLLSTIFSFIILWQLEQRQLLVSSRLIKPLLIISLMVGLGILSASIPGLQSECFNITFSAFLGAAILTIRQQIKKHRDEKN